MFPNLVLSNFLAGAIFISCALIAFLFWQSWHNTGDRLFKHFAAAFAALGAERLILLALGADNESIHFAYLVRLFAYLLIIWAIIEKNRSPHT